VEKMAEEVKEEELIASSEELRKRVKELEEALK